MFLDANGDGRPDLYVANDTDPNRLYLNVSGGGEKLGFHFAETAKSGEGVADRAAGMGIAARRHERRRQALISSSPNSRRQTAKPPY